jgi:hypothetical protein
VVRAKQHIFYVRVPFGLNGLLRPLRHIAGLLDCDGEQTVALETIEQSQPSVASASASSCRSRRCVPLLRGLRRCWIIDMASSLTGTGACGRFDDASS